MAKQYKTIEAKFCGQLFERFAAQAKGNPMFSMMLSSVGNLVKMIDDNPSAQEKVREILDSIVIEWPQNRGEYVEGN